MKQDTRHYPRIDFEAVSDTDKYVVGLVRRAAVSHFQQKREGSVEPFRRETIGWLHNPELSREMAAAVGLAALALTSRLLNNRCSPVPDELIAQITPEADSDSEHSMLH